jgi:hypothetical protein
VKHCPGCSAELADNAVACAHCGGSYQPDGGFRTPWDAEMARLAAERDDKVARAERFGALGKPVPHLFLEGRTGCLLSLLVLAGVVTLTLVLGFSTG